MQRANSVNVECALSTCPFEVLCLGSAKCKVKPHLCAKDLTCAELKRGLLSVIITLAWGNC